MINVGRVIDDPKFAKPYTVYRKTGEWIAGRWEQSESPLLFYGPVIPTSTKDINQVPEGDRIKEVMTFYSRKQIFVTRDENEQSAGTSDEIEWHGNRYRIASVGPFDDYGYTKAFGVRMGSA